MASPLVHPLTPGFAFYFPLSFSFFTLPLLLLLALLSRLLVRLLLRSRRLIPSPSLPWLSPHPPPLSPASRGPRPPLARVPRRLGAPLARRGPDPRPEEPTNEPSTTAVRLDHPRGMRARICARLPIAGVPRVALAPLAPLARAQPRPVPCRAMSSSLLNVQPKIDGPLPAALEGLQPAGLWSVFGKLTSLPRPSKHEDRCVPRGRRPRC